MLAKVLISLVATLAVVATAAEIRFPPKPVLLYNPSESAPVGWYKLDKNTEIKAGDMVAVYAPEWARKLADERRYIPYDNPLIKRVVAIEGDRVCRKNNRISVPKYADIIVHERDSLGREMPVWSECRILNPGEIFFISASDISGFDSRYFGPVGPDDILGKVKFMGNSPLGNSSVLRDRGRK